MSRFIRGYKSKRSEPPPKAETEVQSEPKRVEPKSEKPDSSICKCGHPQVVHHGRAWDPTLLVCHETGCQCKKFS